MSRKTRIGLALVASLHLVMGCAARRVYGPGGKVAELPTGSLEARAYPEVRLFTKGSEQFQVGKIVGLEARLVRFLPAPYWSVVSLKIDLADISGIGLPAKPRSAARAGLADSCLHPGRTGAFWGLLASGAGAVRFQFIVIQVPPEVDESARRISICDHCPDATIRNGRLMPVCLADHISPLDGSQPDPAAPDLAEAVLSHMGEIRPRSLPV